MAELNDLVTRLESAVTRLEKCGGASGVPPPPRPPLANGCTTPTNEQSTVPFVVAYDTLLSGPFKTFLDKSNAIGGDVAAMAKLVESAFRTQRAFLVTAAKSTKPTDAQLPKVLEATGKQIEGVIKFRESKRTSPFFNHLSAVSESIPGLSWVAVEPAPSQYCREMVNAAVFYTNRVLKDYREKDKLHVEWVTAYTGVFNELTDYIKQHHTTGVTWNPRGGSPLDNLRDAAPAAGGVPPPPPGGVPPPPPMVKLEPMAVKADPTAKLFEDINKGLNITSSLKKVADDQKTHKNPSLREGPKPFIKSGTPQAKGPQAPVAKPPRMQLEGKKWFVEYQKDNKEIVISQTSMEHCVYIYKCENSVIQVKNKINSIIMDSCKKCAVVFDSLVSSLEVVNCQSCKAQVLNCVPTLAIEKTDGCMVYLSNNSLGVEIITAKSSEMNILLPTESGEFAEHPIPEQFKTLISDGRLVTTCTEKAGN